jgi:hypothetical protein
MIPILSAISGLSGIRPCAFLGQIQRMVQILVFQGTIQFIKNVHISMGRILHGLQQLLGLFQLALSKPQFYGLFQLFGGSLALFCS